jgi:basic membrane protein A and related proteins
MRRMLPALLACFMSIAFAPGASAADKKPGEYKIALLLPGPINDQSWNATNYAGLLQCNKELGTKMEYLESVQASDYESTFRNYAERGYDLIMAAGTQFDEAANKVATSYPKTTFCVVNGQVSTGANVAPILPKEYEASYLAGIIAGAVSPKGQFATIGGFPNKLMQQLLDVYEATAVQGAKARGLSGAKAVRAFANSWDDVALGKQMASSMIDNGADTLFVYANQVGLGSIQAAKEKGAKFVGFSGDQNDVAKGTVVASVKFDFSTFYTWAVKQYMAGKLSGGVHEGGIAEGIFVPVYTDAVSKATRDAVAKGMKDVVDGKANLKAMMTTH